jgi:hypothetical protein
MTGVLVARVNLFAVEVVELSWEEGRMEGAVVGKLVEASGVSETEVLLDKKLLLSIGDLAELVTTFEEGWDDRGVLGSGLVRLSEALEQG